MNDPRNLIDEFKGMPETDIAESLDRADHGLIIALENIERDFSMGTIVRSANAFGVRHVYIIGRRQWNRRGAMATEKYLHLHYVVSVEEFVIKMRLQARSIIVIDNLPSSVALHQTELPKSSVLVFGSEGQGVSKELQEVCEQVVAIEQFGSTRSINVGSAAAIAMYAWLQQHVL